MDLIDSKLYGVDDLVVIKDEECANDGDEDADCIIDCGVSGLPTRAKGLKRIEVLFRQQLKDGLVVEVRVRSWCGKWLGPVRGD